MLFVLSGLVAGPMGAVLMAAMLDLIPPAERGRKLAYVAMGYSLAAIVVTPLALELAARGGWQTPFVLFGGAGVLLALLCLRLFPTPPTHARSATRLWPLLRAPLCQGALLIVALQMFGHFLLAPTASTTSPITG
ncbi:MFS transporter OS=Stutzerimonas stutzeri OX=316 GN=CXK95_00540 PE=4 SV=1 [Stutzerimonas stutzeri]